MNARNGVIALDSQTMRAGRWCGMFRVCSHNCRGVSLQLVAQIVEA
jgi:hypothetical protein